MASSSTLPGRDSAIYSSRLQTPSLEAISFNQLRESCFIDTEESLNINILEHRENDDTFLVLLQALNENPTLKSWNFIGVIWSTHEVEVLCNVVERSSSLKRLSFEQSYLNLNGIKMLAEMLKKNSLIKELSFSKCDIRQAGASAIASALKTNKCLEGLQIWEDSIGSIGAEELAKMIEVNSSLRCLTILDMQSIAAYPLVSATLGRNRNLELQIWYSQSKVKPAKVVELIPSKKVLRIYRIDTSGSYRIACALARNNTIENMDISGNYINSKCAKEFQRVLQENRSLKHLNMSDTGMSDTGVKHILKALQSNTTLESLSLKGCEGVAGKAVLKTIMNTLQVNSCLKEIDLNETPLQASGKTDCVHQRLRQNTSAEPKIDIRKDMTMTVLRGQKFAGKETLYESIEEGFYEPWQLRGSNCKYIGRHFECDDSNHTFLTHESFQTFKMHLCKEIRKSCKRQNSRYRLKKNLITILTNGIEIRVELGGEMGYYIDILACSSQDLNETLRVLNDVVIQSIQRIYSSFAGCQGVLLVEGILRPQCMQERLKPSCRKGQFVLVEDLKQELLSVPADGIYNYQHTWSDVAEGSSIIVGAGFDYARDLIGEEDFRDVLKRRSHDLYRLAVELDVPSANNIPNSQSAHDDDDGSVSPTTNGIAKGVERVLERLKIIERGLQDIKQEIQGLRYDEHNLLMELHRKLNYLMNFSVQREERKVPRMFYFVRSESGFGKRLVTNIVPSMTELQLHLLCEYRHELHVVDDQPGCKLLKVGNKTVQRILPYLNGLMKMLTFALKVGAHVVAGMGEMIPDLSKEVAQLAESSLGANIVAGIGEMIPYLSTEVAKLGESPSLSAGAVAINSDVNQFRTAQQWLVNFLKRRGCFNGEAIAQKFGLWRVRYTDDGQIAWVCNRHKASGIRNNEVMEIPID